MAKWNSLKIRNCLIWKFKMLNWSILRLILLKPSVQILSYPLKWKLGFFTLKRMYVERYKTSRAAKLNCSIEKLLTLWPLFMDGAKLPEDYRATTRRQFPFYHSVPRFPGVLDTQLIALRRMKDWVDLGASQWFRTWDPWIGNPGP